MVSVKFFSRRSRENALEKWQPRITATQKQMAGLDTVTEKAGNFPRLSKNRREAANKTEKGSRSKDGRKEDGVGRAEDI